MATHEAAHQTVLQLLHTPNLRELIAFAGIKLLAQRRNREDVEQCPVGIERQCLDRLELPDHLSRGRYRGPGCARDCRRGTCKFHKLSTIARHFFLPADLPSPFSQTTIDSRWKNGDGKSAGRK